MKHISLGGLDVSRIGLGAMSMSGFYNVGEGSDAESIPFCLADGVAGCGADLGGDAFRVDVP
jgi:aryl-alcohol dehydrogenase-like predicted oxidoreductase